MESSDGRRADPAAARQGGDAARPQSPPTAPRQRSAPGVPVMPDAAPTGEDPTGTRAAPPPPSPRSERRPTRRHPRAPTGRAAPAAVAPLVAVIRHAPVSAAERRRRRGRNGRFLAGPPTWWGGGPRRPCVRLAGGGCKGQAGRRLAGWHQARPGKVARTGFCQSLPRRELPNAGGEHQRGDMSCQSRMTFGTGWKGSCLHLVHRLFHRYGRCGQSQDGVWVNCPLVDPLYPAGWMAETPFRTVGFPLWHRRDRPNLGRRPYVPRFYAEITVGDELPSG